MVLELRTLPGHERQVNAVAILPDGNQVLSTSLDQTLRIWDIESGEELDRLTDRVGWVNAVEVTQDGQWAILASENNTLRIWDLQSRNVIATFSGDSPLHACAITRNKTMIIAGDRSGQIHFLHLEGAKANQGTKSHYSIP